MRISRSRLLSPRSLLVVALSWTSAGARADEAAAPASPQTANQPLSQEAQKASTDEKVYGFGLGLTHYLGFRKEVDPFTAIDLSGLWRFNKYNFSLGQRLNKSYYVYAEEDEIQAADTVLGVSRAFDKPFYGFQTAASFSLTLPVSEFSRRQEVTSKPRAEVSITQNFFEERLSYTLGAGAQYNISRYKTTKTTPGGSGGSPLREYSWSIDNTLAYTVLEDLTTTAAVSYVRIKYFDLGYRNRVSTATSAALLNTNYSIDLNASYQILEELVLGGGYSQSDLVEKTGGISEAYIFDIYTTQWYVSLSTSF